MGNHALKKKDDIMNYIQWLGIAVWFTLLLEAIRHAGSSHPLEAVDIIVYLFGSALVLVGAAIKER